MDKLLLVFSLFFISFVSSEFIKYKKKNRSFVPKCTKENWTLLYSDYRFKEIISTYESNPSFLVSMTEVSAGKLFRQPSNVDEVNLVLNLKAKHIRKLSTGPFSISPADQKAIEKLLTKFKNKTGSDLKFVMVPRNTPAKILQAFNYFKISIFCTPTKSITNETNLSEYPFKDIIIVDLSRNAFDLIVKMGKYLDKTDNVLFSLKECLSITPPEREQVKKATTKSKLEILRNFVYFGPNSSCWFVRRDNVIEDSLVKFEALHSYTQFLNDFRFNFLGERGSDAGGLTKEWFSLVAKAAFDNDSLYFDTIKTDSYYVIPKSNVVADGHYRFLGAFIAKAITSNTTTQSYFPDFLLKMMMGRKVNFHDLEQIDPELFNSFKSMTGTIVPGAYGTFTYPKMLEDGTSVPVNLKENGSEIEVNDDNKYEFMVLRFKVIVNTPQIEAFVNGFRDLILFRKMPIEILNLDEFRSLITGPTKIDVADWKAKTEYSGYTEWSIQVLWFWEIVDSIDDSKRRQLLRWATGSSSVPMGGFAAMNRPFKIVRTYFDPHRDELNFPYSHTCFNKIDIPEYPNKKMMRTRLLQIIEHEGFGIA